MRGVEASKLLRNTSLQRYKLKHDKYLASYSNYLNFVPYIPSEVPLLMEWTKPLQGVYPVGASTEATTSKMKLVCAINVPFLITPSSVPRTCKVEVMVQELIGVS